MEEIRLIIEGSVSGGFLKFFGYMIMATIIFVTPFAFALGVVAEILNRDNK